ncbi:hypothetical protein [Altererythrobacter sp.]|uniref:hypothetical protein n=1 Tax=Altererythrobacter sp. TaxID=1872480 RepID=UPI003D0B761D
MPRRDITWWLQLATDVALANYLFIDREFIKVALMLVLAQVPLIGSLCSAGLLPAQA